ncbi:phosphotransferase [Terrabacter sp. NPDC080008]|uniref:phosphotransferase n=1 Tax=Terrabacter sp. NPDC080008 TaxID=3155176 RepID=UPI00344FE53C
MTRSPLFLAALASSAVPGLDPVRVQGVETRPGDLFEIAYVQDSQDRRWVVKAPCTAAAGAMLDDVSALSGLLGRRLEIAIPMVRGHSPVPEGRAAVYLRLPGRPLDFAALDAGPLAAEVGRTLGHIHNIEHLVFEEAGRPTYDAEAHRRRQLSELDRAAATGHVPTGLLTRWEHALEDVSVWRFAPSAVHGTFTGDNVLASFEDEDDASTGRVRGVLAWEESRIADPADDFAELVSVAPATTLEAVLDAYSATRIERPDAHLVQRARLAAEMAPLRRLLRALSAGELDLVESTAEQLRALEAGVEAADRRHAQEDRRRTEHAEQARQQAAAVPHPREQPEAQQQPAAPEPDWDATQPHVPFPTPGQTQAVSMTPLLDESGSDAAAAATTSYAVPPAQSRDAPFTESTPGDPSPPTHEPGAEPTPEAVAEPVSAQAQEPEKTQPKQTRAEETRAEETRPEESQPVPVVAPGSEASAFEIDEVEALPGDEEAVLDLHEGASGFVAVDRRGPSRPVGTGDGTGPAEQS